MLKRPITYLDLDDNKITETFYFNLSKTEIIRLDLNDGLAGTLKRIVETQDEKQIFAEFEKLILNSYGVRSEDGKRFEKSPALREAFEQHPAYDALIIELMTNTDAAATFVKGIIPSDVAGQIVMPDQRTPLEKAYEELPKTRPSGPMPPLPPSA